MHVLGKEKIVHHPSQEADACQAATWPAVCTTMHPMIVRPYAPRASCAHDFFTNLLCSVDLLAPLQKVCGPVTLLLDSTAVQQPSCWSQKQGLTNHLMYWSWPLISMSGRLFAAMVAVS